MRFISKIIDRIAIKVTTWGLDRLYGIDCESKVWDEDDDLINIPGYEPYNHKTDYCLSCEATRLVEKMKEIYS